jgi:Holliday junction resolvasome RuvABC endonuclease subunit
MNVPHWGWGVDVRTGALAFAALSTDGQLRTWPIDLSEASGLRGAARLTASRALILSHFGRRVAPTPTVIIVENPTIARTDFRLITLTGVVMEALASAYACPILELTSGQWKKEVIGHGHADKDMIMEHAERRLGYTPPAFSTARTKKLRDEADKLRQDLADATCIARAALNRVNDLVLA